ncbi:MAG: ATP synthase F1 subunit gamma [Bryobacteraceae bacterium]
MPSVLDIKRRIRSVRNTRQITQAMKMISAARLRRAQDRAVAARPYAQMITNVLKSLVTRADVHDPETGELTHPLLAQRAENRILLIVVTADKGLAGAFNANILKAAMKFIASKPDNQIDIEAIGRKARDFFRRRFPMKDENAEQRAGKVQVAGERFGLQVIDFKLANEISKSIVQRYTDEQIDAVYLVYNEFKSVIAQRLVVDRVLPVVEIGTDDVSQSEEQTREERERSAEAAASAGVSLHEADTSEIDRVASQFATKQVDYIYEQSPEELFRSLLPKYVAVQLYRALIESNAAEHAARMTAMDSATNNAKEMIDSLTLKMNRARQASITKEIIEIVSGAAALT